MSPNFQIILTALQEIGLLLESDVKLPSVANVVAGETVRGSWWSHRNAQQIFGVLQEVVDHQDVLTTKLVSGKVTFVHRRLWSNVVTIGTARESWQLKSLSPGAAAILKRVREDGSVTTNKIDWPDKMKPRKLGDAVRELEKRLLIHTAEFHSKSGAHAKELETWKHWTDRNGFKPKALTLVAAKEKLEHIVANLNEQFSATATLPWENP
ncbi:MAG TPA: hypothetical protein VGN86_09675 [Pyrinomonadaceae bacterium]|nr:hypothetical protein [Pyrinomonadaceae bacterium]